MYSYKSIQKHILPVILLSVILFSSCKKEYTEYPYTDIESFTITVADGSTLKAVVQDNNIYVYWPPLQETPATIKPVIALADRAMVSPASGEEVSFAESTVYTVTAQDGTQQQYILRPVNNQPVPYFSIVSNWSYKGTPVFSAKGNVGNAVSARGDYFIEDASLTKVYFIDEQKKETAVVFNPPSKTQISVPVPEMLPAGMYYLKIVSGSRTVTDSIQKFIISQTGMNQLYDIDPIVNTDLAPVTVKRGVSFTITGARLKYVVKAEVFGPDGLPVSLDIVSASDTELVVKVPASAISGAYQPAIRFGNDNPGIYQSWESYGYYPQTFLTVAD